MRYLLDVNALIAFGYSAHQFHQRVTSWAASLSPDGVPKLATSSITELGFVRIVSSAYDVTFDEAMTLLLKFKDLKTIDSVFIPDGNDIRHLPKWVKRHKQTTDGHLAQLAKSNGAILVTLDEGIPGSFLIPGK